MNGLLRRHLLALNISLLVLWPTAAESGAAEDWRDALKKPVASEARKDMLALLEKSGEPYYAARAGLWLGQLEYATGKVEPALGYFQRADALAEEPATRTRSAFWVAHCLNFLQDPSDAGPDAGLKTPALIQGPGDFFRSLAVGDAEIRAGRPREALRHYLSLEGESRQLGLVGPLAYRVALVVAFARSAGESDPIFSWSTLDNWQDELAHAPERGLITALRRRDESIPSRSRRRSSQAATNFAELPGPDQNTQRVKNRSFPVPDFAPPDSSSSDYRSENDRQRPASQQSGSPGSETNWGSSTGTGEGKSEERSQEPSSSRQYIIQLGAFGDRDSARREMERLTTRGLSVRLSPGWKENGGRVYRIHLGNPGSQETQESFARRRLRGLDYQLVLADR